jgi:lipopolysaccharide export system permease protein
VIKEVMGPFLMGLFIFTFLLLANKLFGYMDLLITQGSDMGIVLKLFSSLLLTLLTLTVPMAVLVAILIGLGRLSIDKELLAFRISGINLFRLIAPLIVVALLLSGGMMVMNFTFYPRLMLRVTDLVYKLQFRLITALEPNKFYDNLGSSGISTVIHFTGKSPDQEILKNIQLKVKRREYEEKIGPDGESEVVVTERQYLVLAKSGKIIPDEENKTIGLRLFDGSVIPLDFGDSPEDTVVTFKEMRRMIKPKLDRFAYGEYQKKPREMQLNELLERMKMYKTSDTKKHRRRYGELRRQLYQRISLSLSCLAFTLIAIPLALIIRPSGKSVGFAISFALLFVYFIMLKWGVTLLEQNSPFGVIATFSPNILLGGLGLYLIFLQSRK